MNETFDFVVIGAGSVGSVLARRLSEGGQHTVGVREAGGSDDSALVQCPAGIAGIAKSGRLNRHMHSVPQDYDGWAA